MLFNDRNNNKPYGQAKRGNFKERAQPLKRCAVQEVLGRPDGLKEAGVTRPQASRLNSRLGE